MRMIEIIVENEQFPIRPGKTISTPSNQKKRMIHKHQTCNALQPISIEYSETLFARQRVENPQADVKAHRKRQKDVKATERDEKKNDSVKLRAIGNVLFPFVYPATIKCLTTTEKVDSEK